MSVGLSFICNGWQSFTPKGVLNSGGYINTYLAGTTTPATTYTTNLGDVANANPIPINSGGFPSTGGGAIVEIWLTVGVSYKFVIFDSSNNLIATYDNITGDGTSSAAAIAAAIATLTAANFAALASTSATIGQLIDIPYHTFIDYGGGKFEAVSSTGLTPDNGTISASATAGVYWQRVNYTQLTPYDFGVPPNTSTDVRALMQAAINAHATLGVKIRIPKQTFYFQLSANDQAAVSLPTNSNVYFEKGASFELLPYAAYDNYQVIAIYDADNVVVENAVCNGRRDLRAANATGTGSITTTVMTITGGVTGAFAVGQEITGIGVVQGTFITSFGTGAGGPGTYNLSMTQTVASTTLSGYSGEFGMGISIRGSTNVKLINPVTNNCWGDGIYGGQSTTGGLSYNQNIEIFDHRADNCRRQGCSIISTKAPWVMHNPRWTNINSRAPSAGLDIEPNSNTCFLEGIRIINPTTENCFGFGIQVDIALIMSGSTTAKAVDIEIYGHRDVGSNGAFSVANANTTAGANLISGRILHDSGYSENAKNNAYSASHWDYRGPRVDVIRPVVRNPNRNGQTSPTTGSVFSIYRNNAGLNYTIGNVRIVEPTIILESGTVPKNYFFDNTLNDGDESSNAFIDPILLPTSTLPNTMYRGQVSNKYRQGMRQSVGSETVTGDSAGLGILTSTTAAATYTLGNNTQLFPNGPDIVIEVGGTGFGANIALPAGGNFVGRAVNSGFTIGAGTKGAYMRIKPLGTLQFAVIENVGGWA